MNKIMITDYKEPTTPINNLLYFNNDDLSYSVKDGENIKDILINSKSEQPKSIKINIITNMEQQNKKLKIR